MYMYFTNLSVAVLIANPTHHVLFKIMQYSHVSSNAATYKVMLEERTTVLKNTDSDYIY